jgi:thiamine biosynthesis lipoprotein
MDTILSPRRRTVLQALGAAAMVGACGDRPATALAPVYEYRGPTMGTTYRARIAGTKLTPTAEAAVRVALREAFEAVVAKMSTYLHDSEVSRFNLHAADTPLALSTETLAVFAQAERVSEATAGAFDVTIAPAVDAWGFGPRKTHRVPDAAEIEAFEPSVGWRMLAVDAAGGTLVKERPDVRADLSGIAKGYGVDRAARALDALGVERYMVEAGGEVRTRGRNPEGLPWQIGIERPDAMPPRAHFVVPLAGESMATSGDYRIWFERDGLRYCHEIDPRTGAPIRNGVASVSVVATDCSFADAMSTALMVLGPAEGFALAAARGIAAYFTVRAPGGGFVDRATPAFAALGGRRMRA